MGQVTLILNAIKGRFSPGTWFFGDERSHAKNASRDLLKEEKLEKKEREFIKKMSESVEQGSIEGVVAAYNKFCEAATSEISLENHALVELLNACVSEAKDLQRIIAEESKPEFRKDINEVIDEFLATVENWLRQAASYRSFNIQTSDQASLRQEARHILDNFNVQKVMKQLEKTEDQLHELELRLNETDDEKYSEKELAALRKFRDQVGELRKMDSKIVGALLSLMQQKSVETARSLNQFIEHLKSLGFPEHELVLLYAKRDDLNKKIDATFQSVIGNENGLVRILRGIDRKKMPAPRRKK